MHNEIWSDAVTQAAAIRRGEVSASELVREYLDRIERFDPMLRAYVALDADRAIADARAADDAVRRGADAMPPFLGVTISVKDVIDVAEQKVIYSPEDLAKMDREADRKFREAKQTTPKKPESKEPESRSPNDESKPKDE